MVEHQPLYSADEDEDIPYLRTGLKPDPTLAAKVGSFLKDTLLQAEVLNDEDNFERYQKELEDGYSKNEEHRLTTAAKSSVSLLPTKSLQRFTGYLDKKSPAFFVGWQVSHE